MRLPRPVHVLPSARNLDEEALAASLSPSLRRERGCYFTPAPLVREILERAGTLLPEGTTALSVIDPSAGAGAFLAAASERFPRASLHGIELDREVAQGLSQRVPSARVFVGDALRGGFQALTEQLPDNGFELWVGNPPYNGTSPLLRDKQAYAELRSRISDGLVLPRGNSLRDDFVFFLLLCAGRLRVRPGLLALVTPSSLLDGYLYAGLRQWLLGALNLCGVLDLGVGVFRGARVETCVTFWRSRGRVSAEGGSPTYERRRGAGSPVTNALAFEPAEALAPSSPDFLLRAPPAQARRLDEAWRAEGEPLTTLVPISFPGLKTRFDELLTDASPRRLLERVRAFVDTPPAALEAFADAFSIPPSKREKLRALHAQLPRGLRVEESRIRPFARYAGARHHLGIPPEDWAYCYLDRALIPRGDHRLRGTYDPHLHSTKLVFNVLERPLSALVLTQPGCVHDHRHARFAPSVVPAWLLEGGVKRAPRVGEFGPDVPNLSPGGRRLAERRSVEAVYARIAAFIRSPEVQGVWAPVFGASRILPVPFHQLDG